MGVSCHGLFHKIGGGGTHEVGGIERLISFVKEHIIHRFGIPQTITTDGGSVFISEEFRKFADDMGFKLIRSSPYYARANGQAKASNQSLIKLIKRKIDEYPRRWHEVLSEALWAYRIFVSRIHKDVTIPSGLRSRRCVAMGGHGRIEAC